MTQNQSHSEVQKQSKQATDLITKFDKLITDIQKSMWKENILQASKFLNIKLYNLQKISILKIKQLYRALVCKFYKEENLKSSWHQNQLRIFVWILITYGGVKKKSPDLFNIEQWTQLSTIFQQKTVELCQFQYHSLKKVIDKPQKWSQQEDQLLVSILMQKQIKNKWNQIAKQMFVQSKQQYFRTAKQCRQRWNNYLDPCKIKGNWTIQEDYKIIKTVINKGKKWSSIAKELGNTRTEHMVKNRFKSLIVRQAKANKKLKKNVHQSLVLDIIEKKIQQQINGKRNIQQQKVNYFGSSCSAFKKIAQLKKQHQQKSSTQQKVYNINNSNQFYVYMKLGIIIPPPTFPLFSYAQEHVKLQGIYIKQLSKDSSH